MVGVDNFSDYYSPEFKKLRIANLFANLNINVISCDLGDRASVKELFDCHEFDGVFHFAAQAGVRLTTEENFKYVSSNLLGFVNTISETTLHEVPTFFYASSSSVYGDFSKIPYSESEKNLLPNSFYGATKLCNEIITPTIVKNSSTAARGVRLFTVYGPWGRPDMAYFRISASAVSDVPFTLFGNGEIERDFTFIDDVVNCCIRLNTELSERSVGYSDVVNIGGGKPISINSVIKKIMHLSNKTFDYKIMSGDKNDVAKTTADNSYLKSLIGDYVFTDFDTGISQTLKWAKSDKIQNKLKTWIESVK